MQSGGKPFAEADGHVNHAIQTSHYTAAKWRSTSTCKHERKKDWWAFKAYAWHS